MTASLWSPFPTASWVAFYVRCGCRRQLNRLLYPSRLAAVKQGRPRMSRLQRVTAGGGGGGGGPGRGGGEKGPRGGLFCFVGGGGGVIPHRGAPRRCGPLQQQK